MRTDDTIVAISSAVGAGARMIVRTSGERSSAILSSVTPAKKGTDPFMCEPEPEKKGTVPFLSAVQLEGFEFTAWIYAFRSPRSVTGEDVVEYHVPGNPILAKLLLAQLVQSGARQAEPGEFTARAYFNGRIDLTEAEGVAATISAANERELVASRQLIAGELSRRIEPLVDDLAQALALVEAGIDFSDEGIAFISSQNLAAAIERISLALQEMLDQTPRFERLSHEPAVVLVGHPNAGKSTLLNALIGQERAVVSPVAGTTRDVIWSHLHLRRGIVRLVDAAGIDGDGRSEIAAKMHAHALRAVEQADVLVLVKEIADTRPAPALPRPPDLVVLSKSDLAFGRPPQSGETPGLPVSALRGSGLAALRDALDQVCFGTSGTREPSLALNARHVACIDEAIDHLKQARATATAGDELVAAELRGALDALGEIRGSVTPDDVLGRIFSTFCIGK